MKNILSTNCRIGLMLLLLLSGMRVNGQIENLVMETYYVSDHKDATDTTGYRVLPEGSLTYRVFLDLEEGYRLKSLFGSVNHPLIISSSEVFFNNLERPNSNFGYLLRASWFSYNPTLALDSWLTLGLATRDHSGIPKNLDTDSSLIGGGFNTGGSAGIPGGLLVNDDSLAGIPLTQADGLMPHGQTLTQWFSGGFADFASGLDTTAFGTLKEDTIFRSTNAILQQIAGVGGADENNLVMVAQLTTRGSIRMELNVVLIDTSGKEVVMVARDPESGEKLSPYLMYPLPCGCRDPRYLEFGSNYGCDAPDSCKTLVVLGCMDSLACNYDPDANINMPAICCYPGNCGDRDLSVVCPDPGKATDFSAANLLIYPVPADNEIRLNLQTGTFKDASIRIYNLLGTLLLEQPDISGSETVLDLHFLPGGMYLIQIIQQEVSVTRPFIKHE